MQKIESKTLWSQPPDVLDLHSHQVDLWRIALNLPPASVKPLESHLSADESQRAARFRFPADRDRYIVAHGCLREILVRYLHCQPGQLSFSTNEYGRPSLEDHKLEFNLSHSGNFALIAVSQEHKVGVDVERIRSDLEQDSIARRFFSANEVAELMALPPDQKELAFFNCWTRKEAYIKAQGLGLTLPLNSFDVSLAPIEPAILHATRPNPREADRWTLLALDVDPNYVAALAVEGAALPAPVPSRPSPDGTGQAQVSLSKEQGLEVRFWDWNEAIR
jgi:4'-phosphopantetheinyl transferase